jgi:uncharacterized protein (DUF1778 family)
MPAKTSQLQIRVTAPQKAMLRQRARAAGLGMSAYVLARALQAPGDRFTILVRDLVDAEEPRLLLAELNDLLAGLVPAEFSATVSTAPVAGLSPYLANYLAAMTEQAAHLKRVEAPAWTRDVVPLDEPHFVTSLRSLRMHLVRHAPVPFKRRNIFVDSSVGARV